LLLQLKESQEKKVEISVEADALASVLDFMYTGSIELTAENVIDVLETAEYLQVSGKALLFQLCQ